MAWYICKPTTPGGSMNDGYLVTHTLDMSLPAHPDYLSRGLWVQSEPMSKYTLYVEPYGFIDIPGWAVACAYYSNIIDSDTKPGFKIRLRTTFDISTGDCRMEVNILTDALGVNETLVDVRSETAAVELPVHQTVQDAMGFRQSMRKLNNNGFDAVRGFADSLINLDAGKAITTAQTFDMSAKSNIDDATMANQVTVSGQGSAGSYVALCKSLLRPKVVCHFQEMVGEYNDEKGRPLCAPRRIDTLSGYILCDNVDLSIPATKAEIDEIIGYMNSGFYYE